MKSEGKELPDRTFEEAAGLAAYYSKGRENEKVEIDYVQKKQVKKVAGAAPGFVIYHTNYSNDGDAVESAGRTAIIMPPEKKTCLYFCNSQ